MVTFQEIEQEISGFFSELYQKGPKIRSIPWNLQWSQVSAAQNTNLQLSLLMGQFPLMEYFNLFLKHYLQAVIARD